MSAHDEQLERRYERLLALFPAGHRREYEDEMMGVLMAGAKPRQRYPGLREAVNLVRCAVWLRLGGRGAGSPDRRWASAAAAFGLVACLMLLTSRLGVVGAEVLGAWRIDGRLLIVPGQWWFAMAGWTVAVAFAFTRFRVVAAAGAWVAALSEVAVEVIDYPTWPSHLVEVWWLLVLSIGAALALTVRGRTRPQEALGVRRAVVMSSAFAVLAVLPAVDASLAVVTRYGDGGFSIGALGGYNAPGWLGGHQVTGVITLVPGMICALVVLFCLLRAGAPVRRRVMAMSAPALALYVVVPSLFNGFLVSTQRFHPPVLLVPGQWVFLIVFPLVLFAVGALLVERGERHAYLIALGRSAEREARLKRAAAPS
ncbi:hypothetical protein [Catellatospora citrea]|uniref:Uncharacterized protein n=1 Tax=Catellatospora citrea TaxID=53366 RepID=A0A8J3NZT4_9ACTN|nr:hypothetical protein [Catellatospora citrea]RKE06672.1 hypothetical protein C8E86_1494 [Catellatospora citrea]GIF98668.1 hypothetical protein Cci01nite_37620 [Catellatospora citrea]